MSVFYIAKDQHLFKEYFVKIDLLTNEIKFSESIRNAKGFEMVEEAFAMIHSSKCYECFVIDQNGMRQTENK